jgi:hypothetical protein
LATVIVIDLFVGIVGEALHGGGTNELFDGLRRRGQGPHHHI